MSEATDGLTEGDRLIDGESDTDRLIEAEGELETDGDRLGLCEACEGLADTEGEIDGETDVLRDEDGDVLAEGEIDGLNDWNMTPISTRACPLERESLSLRMSRFEPNLKEPVIPLSS